MKIVRGVGVGIVIGLLLGLAATCIGWAVAIAVTGRLFWPF
jgi:hypothetical protein